MKELNFLDGAVAGIEPGILECEVKMTLESIANNKQQS